MARGRLLALQKAVPGASADPTDHTSLHAELAAVNDALAHTAAQLDAVDAARREFASALERYAAAPKPGPHDKVGVPSAPRPRPLAPPTPSVAHSWTREVGGRRQTCTYPGCGQTACETHVDWQARTASGLWLQFDRTVRPCPPTRRPIPSTNDPDLLRLQQVYAAELLHQRKAMLEHELDRRSNGVARLLHPAIPADPPAVLPLTSTPAAAPLTPDPPPS